MSDFRFALRAFRKSPGFAVVVVATLALGIGANTAIFGLLDQLLLRALPVERPEGLVVLDAPGPYSGSTERHSEAFAPVSHPMFVGLREGAEVFSGVLAHYTTTAHLTVSGETHDVTADLVSGTYFPVLGVEPFLGRLFTAADDVVAGGHPLVVLTHSFWQRRFGGRTGVVGETVRLNGHPMTVIGVSARGFHGVEVGASIDVFVPLRMYAHVLPTWRRDLDDWRLRFLTPMARLADGVSIDEARAGANVVYRQLLVEDLATIETASSSFPERFLRKELLLHPGGRGTSELRYQSRTPVLVLMAMVGLVLLIACANVASLLLARASSRQKEIALRIAIGASRGRLVRQLLVESVLLAVAGGILGLIVSSWTGELLLRALPFEGVSEVFSAEPDLRVGVFALALSLLTALVFGSAPALSASHPSIAPVLKNEARGLSGHSASSRFRRGLVVAQLAVSLLLLIGAGLFVRSLSNLSAIDPGFRAERLLALDVDPSLNGYDLEKRRAVLRELRDELAAEPGVTSVALAEVSLMTDSTWSSSVAVEGYEATQDEDVNPARNGVSPGFFETMGIPLLSGRDFEESDGPDRPKVAIVNEAFVEYFFAGGEPLGRRFAFGRQNEPDVTIVGVVRDGRSATMREAPRRFVYTPYMQSAGLGGVTLYLRTGVEPESLTIPLHRAVARVDPSLPVSELKTMTTRIRESLFVERLVAGLSLAFGGLATLLASLGLYGLLSYAVALRTREIGIRVALGAERRSLLLLVLRESVTLAALGLAIGLPAGYALGKLVEAELYGVSGRDPLAAVAATVLLACATLLAGYVPAARASRLDPLEALRHD